MTYIVSTFSTDQYHVLKSANGIFVRHRLVPSKTMSSSPRIEYSCTRCYTPRPRESKGYHRTINLFPDIPHAYFYRLITGSHHRIQPTPRILHTLLFQAVLDVIMTELRHCSELLPLRSTRNLPMNNAFIKCCKKM